MPWTVAHEATLFIEFSRQEYWSGLPFPSLGIFWTQWLNPDLLHCRGILYCLSHQRSPTSCYSAASTRMEFYIEITSSIHPSDLLFSWELDLFQREAKIRSCLECGWSGKRTLTTHFQVTILSFLLFYCFKAKALFESLTEREEKNGNNDQRCGRSFPCPCYPAGMNRSVQV